MSSRVQTRISQILRYLPAGVARALKEYSELRFWRRRFASEGILRNSHYRQFYTEFFDLSPTAYEGKSVIDIGCGPRGSLEWADLARERVGLDPLVDKYRQLGIERHAMRYVNAPVEAIPFPDGYFDIVTCFNALDHVDDIAVAVSEIRRVLSRGGTFLLIVEANHKPTLAEPIVITDAELKSLLAAKFDIETWRMWIVPDFHDVYRTIQGDPVVAADGKPVFIAAKMTPRQV